ncbi:helix-turn-helix domain-containing protein [Mesorhizobium sp. BH1-1-5]|uniref:helix-turn-helix domain-containing protein n=1 Tax=Mesorhizobium sp. BH1-1-5 TaxID=2876661 RepID=UPI001CCAF4F2|nr:helix-turn-helix transcriptional regulator [Mesorhizobium sp. BH1-1-5]MBZ9989971.1 helix-turn-helix domain-containing protein [Mesorhizobium sp. BH1-1-5]
MSDHNSRLLGEIEQDGVYAAPLLRVRAARETAALLRGLRKQAGLTQQAIAAKLGVSQARISQVESGVLDFLPPLDFIYLFTDACGARLSLHAEEKNAVTAAAPMRAVATPTAMAAGLAEEPLAERWRAEADAGEARVADVAAPARLRTYRIAARGTALGPETITRDIPDAGDEALRHLDDNGIARVGVRLREGDILVGKTTPISDDSTESPETRLLRAIFGEKGPVRDTSLRMPAGITGTVVAVHDGSRSGERSVAVDVALEEAREFAVSREAAPEAIPESLEILTREMESRRAAIGTPASAAPAEPIPEPPRTLKESE